MPLVDALHLQVKECSEVFFTMTDHNEYVYLVCPVPDLVVRYEFVQSDSRRPSGYDISGWSVKFSLLYTLMASDNLPEPKYY